MTIIILQIKILQRYRALFYVLGSMSFRECWSRFPMKFLVLSRFKAEGVRECEGQTQTVAGLSPQIQGSRIPKYKSWSQKSEISCFADENTFLSASLLILKYNFTKPSQDPGNILNISVVLVMIFNLFWWQSCLGQYDLLEDKQWGEGEYANLWSYLHCRDMMEWLLWLKCWNGRMKAVRKDM